MSTLVVSNQLQRQAAKFLLLQCAMVAFVQQWLNLARQALKLFRRFDHSRERVSEQLAILSAVEPLLNSPSSICRGRSPRA